FIKRFNNIKPSNIKGIRYSPRANPPDRRRGRSSHGRAGKSSTAADKVGSTVGGAGFSGDVAPLYGQPLRFRRSADAGCADPGGPPGCGENSPPLVQPPWFRQSLFIARSHPRVAVPA